MKHHVDVLKKHVDANSIDGKVNNYSRIYIPMLRGLRPVHFTENDIEIKFINNIDSYKKRTVYDYNWNEEQSNSVYTGLSIYSDIQKKLLDKRSDRKRIREFEDFLRDNFFPNKTVTLIPKIGDDSLLIGIGEDDERLTHQLGDGIQSLIVLLYPIFLRKGENVLFFIEEPELSLHPGMQRVFLETLLSEQFKTMQFVFTTHSNHFLDMTLDANNISIYSVKKGNNSKFRIDLLENDTNNVLRDLGVRNASVFLSNCTIWVEGITDRKYIRHFLSIYMEEHGSKKYLEDLHYSFVEYAGSNITHWDFENNNASKAIKASRINNKIFLVVDSDIKYTGKKSDAKVKRHESLRTALGENFYVTEGKEIENILSVNSLRKILEQYEDAEIIEQVCVEASRNVSSKSTNSEEPIKKPKYWKHQLGQYLDEQLADKRKRKSSYEDFLSGSKDKFCELAISGISSYDDLSEEAIVLCEKIYAFIEASNN